MINPNNLKFLIISSVILAACNPPAVEEMESAKKEPETTNVASEEMQNLENPQYIAYSETNYNELLGKKPFALFFHAPWCHVCRGMEENITKELSSFPKNTIIMKADYDSETELKQKYGITSQSVMIFINKEGEVVNTLVGPNNEQIIKAISQT